ncbi:MAG: M48 family metallopeptidase [Desulfovibrionales bacterium]
MNIYLTIVIVSLVGGYIVTLVTSVLNRQHVSLHLPEEFVGTYDPDRYQRSQAYTRQSIFLNLSAATFDLALLLGFLFLGGFNWLDLMLRPMIDSELLRGLAYLGVLFVAADLLSTPFELYRIFVLEERFGFNTMTPRLYVTDKIKSLLLAVIIGIPILASILHILQNYGAWAWVLCWLLVSAAVLLLQYLAPRYILPLFNTFTPLAPGELREKIEALVRRTGFEPEGVFIMDGSKRSTKSNAFFTGLGRHKRIALYDTLVQDHAQDELLAILAHEIGHFKLGHIRKNMLVTLAKSALVFLLMSLAISHPPLHAAFGMDNVTVYAGMVFFFLLYSPVSMATGVFFNALSRRFEYQADRFAADLLDTPGPLVRALKRLAVKNLSNLTPHPWYVFLNYSHPPVLRRITALQHSPQ